MDTGAKLAVSINEGAAMLNIKRDLLYRLVLAGEIPSVKIGARRVLPVAGLREWLEKNTVAAATG